MSEVPKVVESLPAAVFRLPQKLFVFGWPLTWREAEGMDHPLEDLHSFQGSPGVRPSMTALFGPFVPSFFRAVVVAFC